MSAPATNVRPTPEERDFVWSKGLFIAGHARSGTSILQASLNASPDCYILGEANLHDNIGKARFAHWYRAMHEGFLNPPSKSTSCPSPPDGEGIGWDTLMNIGRRYKYIGDKFAFRSKSLGYDFDKNRLFLQDFFGGSTVLCTLRRPQDVLFSNNRMFKPSDLDVYAESYIECLIYQIELFFCLDRVYFFNIHSINASMFDELAERLDCRLPHAFQYYRNEFQNRDHPALTEGTPELMALAERAFAKVSSLFADNSFECSDRLQLMQLNRSLKGDLRNYAANRPGFSENATP